MPVPLSLFAMPHTSLFLKESDANISNTRAQCLFGTGYIVVASRKRKKAALSISFKYILKYCSLGTAWSAATYRPSKLRQDDKIFQCLIPCVSKNGRPKASKADCLDWSRLLKLSLTVPATYSYKPRNIGWQVDSYIKSIVHDIWTSFDAVTGESVLTWWVALQSHQIESPPTGWCPHPGEHKLMSLVLTKSRWAFPAFPSGIATLMPCSSKKASRQFEIASKSFTSSLLSCLECECVLILFHFCVFHDKFLSCSTFSICFISFTVWFSPWHLPRSTSPSPSWPETEDVRNELVTKMNMIRKLSLEK